MYANPQETVDCDGFATLDPNAIYDPELPGQRQYYQKQLAQLPDNMRVLDTLNAALPGKGRLLEIGSFMGIFLDRIQADGWKAVGLEPDRRAYNYARAHYKLEVIDGLLPVPAVPGGQFDAVVMLHVIEHMPDPAANLREIRRLLRPGGVLAVETPRFNSLAFKLLGRRERSVQNCDGHIYFFTEESLRQLLEHNGFKVFKTDRVGRTLTVDRLFYNVGLVTRNEPFKRWLNRISLKLGLDRVKVHVNARDMQRMYARAV